MKIESLTYRGKANKSLHGYTGFRYMSVWQTGFQELVFNSHADAEKYAVIKNAKYVKNKS